MRIVFFYHSLISDWNHGNAHFLRGLCTELQQQGHEVLVYEPHDAWSVSQLVKEQGDAPIKEFHRFYPELSSEPYEVDRLDLDSVLKQADMVLVHEWNDPNLVNRIGEHHRLNPHYNLFFHDSHHRIVTDPASMSRFNLSQYDGVLAFGEIISKMYQEQGLCRRTWTWHEAADVRIFRPLSPPASIRRKWDLVWIGNWGDEERTSELLEFLIEPIEELGLRACFYGVRYPPEAIQRLKKASIEFKGWLPNFRVPEVYSQARFTVHIPRRPYRVALRGIPTIRVFEALACGIPLITTAWEDSENLFRCGRDFLMVRTQEEMKSSMQSLLHDPSLSKELVMSGLERIKDHHTCAHRVGQLMQIHAQVCHEKQILHKENLG